MSTAAIVLAAGSSTRMGEAKQLLDWGGTTLLGHVVGRVLEWPVDEVWVVLGADADEVQATVDFGDAGVVVNENHAEGIASSIRVGLDVLFRTSEVRRTFIVMGDQPDIDAAVPAGLIAKAEETGQPVIIPKYRYERSNPVLVDRWLWERLMSLDGDEGAKGLFASHPEWVEEVWFDRLPPRDVDTTLDYEEQRPRRPV
jgi:molybdenum cofactor cytidylyltransferase